MLYSASQFSQGCATNFQNLVIQKFLKNVIIGKFNNLNRSTSYKEMSMSTVPTPLKAADTIQKICFGPIDYHLKMT